MGIYLPNMEMPKSCAKCTLFGEYGCPFIGAVGYALTRGERNEDCPLVPVPPHGRLIDADALMKGEGRYIISFGKEGIDVAEINRAPTIIEEER